MAARKFAISVPEEVMRQVDQAAAHRGVTRSRFIGDVLRRVAGARSDEEITHRINRVFADPALAREQRDTASALHSISHGQGAKW